MALAPLENTSLTTRGREDSERDLEGKDKSQSLIERTRLKYNVPRREGQLLAR
jgi:hypothetical protein